MKWEVRSWFGKRLGLATLAAACVITAGLLAGCGGSSGSSSGGGGGGGDEAEGGTIPYGVITPFTGAYAAYGEPEKASVEAAVNSVNEAGGVKVGDQTYQFEAKAYDSGFDPSKTVTETRQAMSQDGVHFLEILGGELIPAVQPITGENALIFGVADGNEFLGPEQPFTFRAFYEMPESVSASLRYLKPKLGANPSVAMVYNNTQEGKELASLSTEVAEELGYSSSATFVEAEATDFTSALTNVLAENPEVIDFGADAPAQYATMVKQARQLGYTGKFVFPDTLVQSVLNETAGKEAAAGSVTSPTFIDFKTPEGEKWAKYVEEKSGPLQGWAACSYDNILLLKAAIEKAESTEPAKVAEALHEVKLTNGLLGETHYAKRKQSANGYTMTGMNYPVAELTKSGGLKIVATYTG